MAVHLSIGRIRSVSLAVSLVALVGLAVVAGPVYLPIHPGPEVEPGLRVETAPGPGSASVAPRPSGGGRHAAEARADSRVATGAGHDAEFAGLPERAPAAGRIPKTGAVGAGSAEGATETRAEPAGPRAAASQPLAPREQVAVARRVVEPRNSVEPSSRPENMARPEHMAPIPVRAPRRADAGTTARGARAMFERGAKIQLKMDANVYITSRNIPENDRLLEAYSADQAAKGIGHAVPGLLDIAAQAYRIQAAAGTANKTYSLADAMRDAVWRKKTAAKLKTLMTARNTCPEAEANSGASRPSIGFGNTC